MDVVYISWDKAIKMCYRLAEKVLKSRQEFNAVIAISRGGLIPARIISDILGVDELYTIRSKFWGTGRTIASEPLIKVPQNIDVENKDILVVDEVVDTGATMMKTVEIIKKLGARKVKTATLHYKLRSKFIPDYYVEKVKKWVWIFYPWSFSETLFGLAKMRGYKDVVYGASKIIKELKIEEVLIDFESLKLSLKAYLEGDEKCINNIR